MTTVRNVDISWNRILMAQRTGHQFDYDSCRLNAPTENMPAQPAIYWLKFGGRFLPGDTVTVAGVTLTAVAETATPTEMQFAAGPAINAVNAFRNATFTDFNATSFRNNLVLSQKVPGTGDMPVAALTAVTEAAAPAIFESVVDGSWAANDTITISGTPYTGVEGEPTGNQFSVGTSEAAAPAIFEAVVDGSWAANDTITISGTPYTGVEGEPTGNQFSVGTSEAAAPAIFEAVVDGSWKANDTITISGTTYTGVEGAATGNQFSVGTTETPATPSEIVQDLLTAGVTATGMDVTGSSGKLIFSQTVAGTGDAPEITFNNAGESGSVVLTQTALYRAASETPATPSEIVQDLLTAGVTATGMTVTGSSGKLIFSQTVAGTGDEPEITFNNAGDSGSVVLTQTASYRAASETTATPSEIVQDLLTAGVTATGMDVTGSSGKLIFSQTVAGTGDAPVVTFTNAADSGSVVLTQTASYRAATEKPVTSGSVESNTYQPYQMEQAGAAYNLIPGDAVKKVGVTPQGTVIVEPINVTVAADIEAFFGFITDSRMVYPEEVYDSVAIATRDAYLNMERMPKADPFGNPITWEAVEGTLMSKAMDNGTNFRFGAGHDIQGTY